MITEVGERRTLARSTATQTVLIAVSRLTGFVRIVIVAGVLGTTFLGNTYQSANTIPNIVFELFAAGALQAVLVPSLVSRFDRGDHRGAERLAGSVLGHTALGLAVLAVAFERAQVTDRHHLREELHFLHPRFDVGDGVDLVLGQFVGQQHRRRLLVREPAHLLDLLRDGLTELLLGDLVRVEVRVDVCYRTH